MKKCLNILVFILTLSSVVAGGKPSAEDIPSFVGYVPDEFIVVLKETGPAVHTSAVPAFKALQQTFDVARVRPQFPRFRGKASQSPAERNLARRLKVRFKRGTLKAAMAAYARHPRVEHVEPIGIHTVSVVPNDPYYQNPPPASEHWDYWDAYGIDAESAWDLETGSDQVVVAILDTGVRYFHQDLGGVWPDWQPWGPDDPQAHGNIWINPFEIPANGIDDDGNGYIDDTLGWDFVDSNDVPEPCVDVDCTTPDNDPDDGNGHGTHIAGTVAAMTNNGTLVSGVAGGWSDGTVYGHGNGVKILPLRIGYSAGIRGKGFVRMDWAAEAMDYVAAQVQRGVNITAINCSWGSSDTGGLSAAVDNLLANDVVVVVAAGNDSSNIPEYLNSRDDCVDVAATNRDGEGALFSNYGKWVDVAAPGVDIVSTYRDRYESDPNVQEIAVLSGTSMAAPHVAGIVALLESYDSRLTGPQKVQTILSNVIPYTDSLDLGSGIANARLALEALAPVRDYADAEIPVFGSVDGSCLKTFDSDNVYESLRENRPWGRLKKLGHYLEHKWTIHVTGGASVIFYVEAYQTTKNERDHFVFSYSTDDTSYTEMLTVTNTADDNTLDGYALPANTRGTVYIRVQETNQSGKNHNKDTLYIDQMYIESNGWCDGDGFNCQQ